MKTVTEHLFNQSKNACTEQQWPPTGLVEFFNWVKKKVEQVPANLIDTAEIEIGSEENFGVTSPIISISYKRPKTKAEFDAEDAEKRQRRSDLERVQEAQDRREFARLKAKYEPENKPRYEVISSLNCTGLPIGFTMTTCFAGPMLIRHNARPDPGCAPFRLAADADFMAAKNDSLTVQLLNNPICGPFWCEIRRDVVACIP